MPRIDGLRKGWTSNTRYTDEQRIHAVQLYAKGMTFAKISVATGISEPYLKTLVKKAHITTRPSGVQEGNVSRTGKVHSEATRTKISQRHLDSGHRPSSEATAKGQPKTLSVRWGKHTKDPIKTYMASYRLGAHARGLVFDLKRDEFQELIQQPCFYCGQKPEQRNVARRMPLVCNGIDRVDNALGYTYANCRAACKICNVMKSSHGAAFFIQRCKMIAKCWDHNEL